MLHVAVTRSSSDGVAICYALPVLQMTSFYFTNANDVPLPYIDDFRVDDVTNNRVAMDVRGLHRLGGPVTRPDPTRPRSLRPG